MKAILYHAYGSPDLLKLVDIDKPAPNDDEVLIKIRAASLNALDWRMLRGKPYFARLFMGGLIRPRNTRPGRDLAGLVEAVGKNVTRFKPGDEVFGAAMGSCAEYVCAHQDKLALKPANISFEQAAAVPVAGVTALQGLRDKGLIAHGQKVLVDGASGGVGTFAVQIAKAWGADVTAVCSTRNLEQARSLGADQVIDYQREDFTKSGQRYDLILGANAHHSIFAYRKILSPGGRYVMAGGGSAQILQAMALGPLLSAMGRNKMSSFIADVNSKDLDVLKNFLATGKIVSVIDKRYPLSATADAIRYLEEGHARGKVIITI